MTGIHARGRGHDEKDDDEKICWNGVRWDWIGTLNREGAAVLGKSLEGIPLDLEMKEDGLRDVVGAREGIGIVAWKIDSMDDE